MFSKQKPVNGNGTPIVSKVVDFDTLTDTHDKKHVIEKKVNVSAPQRGLFSTFWPFKWPSNFSQQQLSVAKDISSVDQHTLDGLNSVRSPEDKVIAMKKLKTENSSEEFIDVEYKQLSYAEAASLRVVRESKGSKVTSKKPKTDLVVDQDDDLEKSITDVELAEAAKKSIRYART